MSPKIWSLKGPVFNRGSRYETTGLAGTRRRGDQPPHVLGGIKFARSTGRLSRRDVHFKLENHRSWPPRQPAIRKPSHRCPHAGHWTLRQARPPWSL